MQGRNKMFLPRGALLLLFIRWKFLSDEEREISLHFSKVNFYVSDTKLNFTGVRVIKGAYSHTHTVNSIQELQLNCKSLLQCLKQHMPYMLNKQKFHLLKLHLSHNIEDFGPPLLIMHEGEIDKQILVLS